MATQIKLIIDHLSGRLIPEDIQIDSGTPPGYEEKLQEAFRQRMKRRAHRVLQTMPPSDRRTILNFLENEQEVREAKLLLENLEYNEVSIRNMNKMSRHLADSKRQIANQAHSRLLEENELMSVFVGGASQAYASSDNSPNSD